MARATVVGAAHGTTGRSPQRRRRWGFGKTAGAVARLLSGAQPLAHAPSLVHHRRRCCCHRHCCCHRARAVTLSVPRLRRHALAITAAALASISSAIGDHGQRHVGLGVMPRDGKPQDPFEAFRKRKSTQVQIGIEVSNSKRYSYM